MSEPIVIIEDSCPTLSKRSELLYRISVNEKSEFLLTIINNSANGYFNEEAVLINRIIDILSKAKNPFSGYILEPLFRRKSINSPFFVLAACLNEGIIKPDKRCYVLNDTKPFMERLKKLQAEKVKPAPKKTARPKKAPAA